MAKVELDALKKLLEKNEVAVVKRNQILKDIQLLLEQEALDKEMSPPAVKKEFLVLVSDPKKALAAAYPEGVVGWVVQIPEGEDAGQTVPRILQSAYNHNATPAGSKFPVETVGEALESVGPKIFTEQNVFVKTKVPVRVLTTDNRLPQEAPLPGV